MVDPDDKRLTEFVWRIVDPDNLVLIEAPPASKTGSNYLGATLNRVAGLRIAAVPGSIPSSSPPVGDPMVAEGVGWGGFRLGASRQELIKTFGPPDPNNDPESEWISWKSTYHVDCMIDDARGTNHLRFGEGFSRSLGSGVRIGSSEADARAAYGESDYTVNHPTTKMLTYYRHGLLMWLRRGAVESFQVFAPATTSVAEARATSSMLLRQRTKARSRMAEDRKRFSQQELSEIGLLYHAQDRTLNIEEARTNLRVLLEKFPSSNRAGCAVVCLGQASRGDEQIAYYRLAISDYTDCYFGDGVQVGALARFLLGKVRQTSGRVDEARALYAEIRRNYPESVDHDGRLLLKKLPPLAEASGD